MPINTTNNNVADSFKTKCSENDENGFGEFELVPLPIQMFLWRQTNHFLGSKVDKLYEASCITFERIVVQNILYGLSPSLTNAFNQISRWRFVRASFPHIVQCCSSLIIERVNEDESMPMNSSLVKMLYILHWLLLDASIECNENIINSADSDKSDNKDNNGNLSICFRQLTYPISSIQLFVFLLAPLFHTIKESEIKDHIRLQSGIRVWQALWQNRLPEILCFCAPVKQRKNHLSNYELYNLLVNKATTTAAGAEDAGIYLGDEPISVPVKILKSSSKRKSGRKLTTIPPPKPPRSDLSVLREIQQNQQKKSNGNNSDEIEKQIKTNEIIASTAANDKMQQYEIQSEQTGTQIQSSEIPNAFLIIRSVSDYKACEIGNEIDYGKNIRKSKTDFFQPSLDTDVEDITQIEKTLHFKEDSSCSNSELFNINDKAPLVTLHDICSTTSVDNSSRISVDFSMIKSIKSSCTTIKSNSSALSQISDQQTYSIKPSTSKEPQIIQKMYDDTVSVTSQQTVIKKQICSKNFTFNKGRKDSCSEQSEKCENFDNDPREARYLDIAVIRCLLIKSWSEEGIYWAMKYLFNRLTDIRVYCQNIIDNSFRSRSNSVPATTMFFKGSRNEGFDAECLMWTDLQDQTELINKRLINIMKKSYSKSSLHKNSITNNQICQEKQNCLNPEMSDVCSVSVNTLHVPTKKYSRALENRKKLRSLSEPSHSNYFSTLSKELSTPLSNASNFISTNGISLISNQEEFYTEAIGCSTYIEKNGHLSLSVILKINCLLTDSGTSITVRTLELVLNICDILLNMPGADYQTFYESIILIIFRTYLRLGCPNGCNEGMQTPQAVFLRVKVRNLLLQMHKNSPQQLSQMLNSHINTMNYQYLLDCIHAMTIFCKSDNDNKSNEICDSLNINQIPSYKNNFNESKSEIEGILLSSLLTLVVSKFMRKVNEILQPENMSLCQDIRMFVNYIQRHYGNALRKTALSALCPEISTNEPCDELENNGENPGSKSSNASEIASCHRLVPDGNGSISSYSRDNVSLRRGLFKKKEKIDNLMPTSNVINLVEDENDWSNNNGTIAGGSNEGGGSCIGSSPTTLHNIPLIIDENNESIGNGSPLLSSHQQTTKKKAINTISSSGNSGAFNLLKSVRNGNSEEDLWVCDEPLKNYDDSSICAEDNNNLSTNNNELGKNRLFRTNINQKQCYNQIRNSLSTENSLLNDSESQEIKKKSLPPYLPPRRLIIINDVREGARRFSFLLEMCDPGLFPDIPLVGALSELKSPVLSRAVLLLECAHFVNRCNSGDWPEWTRFSLNNNIVNRTNTSSFYAGNSSSTASGGNFSSNLMQNVLRKASFLHRAAGRNFYGWAVQIAICLQNLTETEDQQQKTDEDWRNIKLIDELEDFIDDGTVNNAKGEGCPPALQLLACTLLYQITSFIRETFQLLPRSRISQKNTNLGWEKLMSHRRWSILSNTFNQQSGSIHSISDLHPTILPERRVSYSTADESSPRGSRDLIEDPFINSQLIFSEKKERSSLPFDTSQLMHILQKIASFTRLFSKSQISNESMSSSLIDDNNKSFFCDEYSKLKTMDKNSKLSNKRHVKLSISNSSKLHSNSLPFYFVLRKSNDNEENKPLNNFIEEKDSGRRLAQGRQRLLKRPINQQQQSNVLFHQNSIKNRKRDSIRNRKMSRLQTDNGMSMQDNREINAFDSITNASKFRENLKPNSINAKYNSTGNANNIYYNNDLSTSTIKQSSQSSTSCNTDSVHFSPEKQNTGASAQCTYNTNNNNSSATHKHSIEDEEEEMIKNLPWINVFVLISNRFNMNCTHEPVCTRWCFERVYRQCKRLNEALLIVYEDLSLPKKKLIDRRKQYINNWQILKKNINKQKQSPNPRRESATVRQSGVDRMPQALCNQLIEKFNETVEETKAGTSKRQLDNFDINIDSNELKQKISLMNVFIKTQMLNIIHSPLSGLLKSAIVMNQDHYKAMIKISWTLLIHYDLHIVSSASAMFICCAVKCSEESVKIIKDDLMSTDSTCRSKAVCRFFALWKNRFHVWLKMEDNAQMIFKVPPPVIDFTLPSPPIGQSQLPMVDSPWMPTSKTKVEELTLKEEEHSTSQTIMTMTRTRRKQKQEMVKRAVREAEERQSELRQQYLLRSTAIVQLAAYEPALFYQQQHAQNAASNQQQQQTQSNQQQQNLQQQQPQQQQQNIDENDFLLFQQSFTQQQMQSQSLQTQQSQTQQQLKNQSVLPVAQPLLPSSILSIVPIIIELFDDIEIDQDGNSVGDVCRKISWNCLIEDSSLFLRNFLEKFTDFLKQEYLFSLLRKLILTFNPLPSQMAYTLLNYLFGLIMFYVRSPCKGSDRATSLALSLTWLIAPYVHGLYFKDLKQTLKKEQCDQAIMITANVPAAKKIVVHGPDSSMGGIPSQFPILEDTQFQQILTDSLEFFNISKDEIDLYHLIDSKTGIFHNPNSFVRDFYFFHRSFYPQLTLLKVDPNVAAIKIRECAFQQKLIEIGKCLLTHSALKFSNVSQRIFFLHDEFTHLPSFPRRSVESCFGMYHGEMGTELQSIDSLHKFVWGTLISDMFEKMENAFMFDDLHLFINVINGIMIIHCEDILILRRCMATYITMAIHFNTLFASQGFFLIMPTILRCYSQRQTNCMFTQVVEFVCKQFYILHRKPFLLQMFGSIADICDYNLKDLEFNPMQIKAKYLFSLLLAMENMTDLIDQIDILTLVNYPKPLKALDLCYKDDPNTFMILTDALASCVTVCAVAPESKRSYQMLLIMQSIMPCFLKYLENESKKMTNSPASIKHEITIYTTLCIEMKTLVNSCETLSRGPQRSFEIDGVISERGKSFIADSPQFFDPPTTTGEDEPNKTLFGHQTSTKKNTTNYFEFDALDNSDMQKEIFRGPRNSLLSLCAMFTVKAGFRLKELSKLNSINSEYAIRIPEVFDHKCHAKLSEVTVALLKIAPYDLNTLSCIGLQKFFLNIMPVVDWSVESNRSVLNVILRRLDKTIGKVAKKQTLRRRVNWQSISVWLDGLYQTLVSYPYMAHLHPVKTITQMCLRLAMGDQCMEDTMTSNSLINQNQNTVLNSQVPPVIFCNSVLKLTAFLIQALGQSAFSIEYICSIDGLGSLSECVEAVLCNILMPLFLKSAVPGKDAPQFQSKDIVFCLNFMHNAICPSLAMQNYVPISNPAVVRDNTGRQGSVSVTDRGHFATVSTLCVIRESVIQCVLLALKIMIIVFQKQMTQHWVKVAKIVKELILKKIGGSSLLAFLNFLLNSNLPISLIIQPLVFDKFNQRISNEQEANWQNEICEIATNSAETTNQTNVQLLPSFTNSNILTFEQNLTSIKTSYCTLSKLSQELQSMKGELTNKIIENQQTPIVDLHSDSVSNVSTSIHRNTPSNSSEARRLSSSTTLTKLRSVTNNAKSSVSGVNMTPLISTNFLSGTINNGDEILSDNRTISEKTEDELSSNSQSKASTFAELVENLRKSSSASISKLNLTKNYIKKLPSLQEKDLTKDDENNSKYLFSNQLNSQNQQSSSSIGMFRSVKQHKSHHLVNILKNEEKKKIEMTENNHRRTKSLSKKRLNVVEDPVIVTPLVIAQTRTDLSLFPQTSSIHSSCLQSEQNSVNTNRTRMVSFSTQIKSNTSQTSDGGDSSEFYITSKHHVI